MNRRTGRRARADRYQYDFVAIPECWQPPKNYQDPQGFNAWIETGLSLAADPQRWIVGVLVTLAELQIRAAIAKGDRLITFDSDYLPLTLAGFVLEEAGARVESEGLQLPSLVLSGVAK